MLERRSGSIINISSMLGSGGSEYVNPAYHAAKAAVNNLTDSSRPNGATGECG